MTAAQRPDPALVPEAFSETDFRIRAAARLLAMPPVANGDPRTATTYGRSDWDLTPDLAAEFATSVTLRLAAVLVPIMLGNELTVLLTQRTETLASHAGQIAFPGGKIDPEDADAKAAALREAHEEIGLAPRFVEPLGYLDGYRTGTGFHITPLVALVHPGYALSLAADEVADVFEVPLHFLMSTANHHRHERPWRGQTRAYWAMPYGERYVWGATAGIVKNLSDRLYPS